MRLNVYRAVTCLVLLGLHHWASAEVSQETAQALMRKSGVWAQLGDVAAQVKTGMRESIRSAKISDDEVLRLEQLADAAFSADGLRASFLHILSQQATPAQSADALQWYDSPNGQLMTRLEEQSSTTMDDMNRVMGEGNQILAKASAKRQALLNQTARSTHAVEGMVTMQINTTVAVLQGMAKVMPDASRPSAADMRKVFEAQRPQMEAASMGIVLSMFALTYQQASDKALAQYVKFLSSPSGAALMRTMLQAFDTSLSGAAQRLGSGLPKTPGVTSL